LGSIGKGYALDSIQQHLRRSVRSALLSGGASSIYALGQGDAAQAGWSVGLRNPRDKSKRMALLRMRDVALATSGNEEQFFELGGKRYGHLIDPRTGWPADTVTSASVVTDSAALADALATAFFIGGRALAEIYCRSHSNVMILLTERDALHPVCIGTHPRCEVELLYE
jgi:FAD:protein FMN transferase